MKIQSAVDIKALSADDKDELIAEITRELARQREANNSLTSIAQHANQGLTVWKAITTASAAVVAVLIGIIWINGEYSTWQKIKAAHQIRDDSNQITIGHKSLTSSDIAWLRTQLQLPSATEIIARENIESEVTSLGFVKFNQRILIKDASEPDIALTRHATHYANTYLDSRTDLTQRWSRIWFIEKEK